MRNILLLFLIAVCTSAKAQTYRMGRGIISFISDAPLELISAQTKYFNAIYQANTNQCVVSIMMNSFKGFNSELQNEHYNENYLETTKYPEAKFIGKIVDDFDRKKKGEYTVRVKGKFTLHGVTKEELILCNLKVLDEKSFKLESDFELDLAEFNIAIPKIVHKKIAEHIKVHVSIILNES